MQPRRWLIVVESIALKLVFGILPLNFDCRSKRFRKRLANVMFCVVFLVLFAVLGPFVCVALYTNNLSAENSITKLLGAVQFTFIYLVILVVQVMFIVKKETLYGLLNEMFELKHDLETAQSRTLSGFSMYSLMFLKILLLDFTVSLSSLVSFEEDIPKLALSSVLFYAMMHFVSIIENLILLGLAICGTMQVMINTIVKQLARRPIWSKQASAPSLVQMYMAHCRNEEIVKKFMDTLNFPTLMLTGWYFFMIIFAVYYMYVYAFEASERGMKWDEVKACMVPFIYLLYQCVQLYLLMLVPSVYTDRAKKMMRLLNLVCANQPHHHARQDRLIELLMVDCLQRNYSISNYGMYAINRALLFGMIATITSYLIILIQFHIQEYK
ncbi:uncharacterized protein LOC128710059 [Anopheles marshallii]|uniref:uncharacterized protein LOC128710059 n=1 Tax=Anopheles marshallii TaxID=1521116 RepID=UPI00237AC867|nr:uncharacterized protein LOC128710059 [Anopheles marshallii]